MEKNEKKESFMGEKRMNGPSEKVALVADFGTLYIRKFQNGQIARPIKGVMTLSKKQGHIYTVSKKDAITSTGYRWLNKVASISIITPPTVAFGGIKQANPFVERNAKTKAIEAVTIHKIGVGYNPAGNIVVADKTLFYNVYTYFIQSIQAKMKQEEWKWDKNVKKMKPTGNMKFPNCAVIGTIEDRPTTEFVKDAKWAFFETQSPLGIWVDYTNAGIQACLEEHTQRQRFGDRIAQTIVERNIYASHPAIGISQVSCGPDETAKVTVWGYKHELQPENIQDIMKQADEGKGTITVQAEIIDPKLDEEQAIITEIGGEEEKEIKPKVGETEPPEEFFKNQKVEADKNKKVD